jgi:hypothetical protein
VVESIGHFAFLVAESEAASWMVKRARAARERMGIREYQ